MIFEINWWQEKKIYFNICCLISFAKSPHLTAIINLFDMNQIIKQFDLIRFCSEKINANRKSQPATYFDFNSFAKNAKTKTKKSEKKSKSNKSNKKNY